MARKNGVWPRTIYHSHATPQAHTRMHTRALVSSSAVSLANHGAKKTLEMEAVSFIRIYINKLKYETALCMTK